MAFVGRVPLVTGPISVEVNDGDGGITTESRAILVNNVVPDLTATGSSAGIAGQPYVLTLADLVDSGTDALLADGISVDWGDGTVTTHDAPGNITHVYSTVGSFNIGISLTDEDGSHANVTAVSVDVQALATRIVTIGDAPERLSGRGDQWINAWTDPEVSITHKADFTNAAETWSAAKLSSLSPQALAGGDIYSGDLGVSGQSAATSPIRQEIDGKEVLRISLSEETTALTLHLSRFFAQDDGSSFVESGRVRLLDAAGESVGETVFHADTLGGLKEINVTSELVFTAIELNAGIYNGTEFVFGGYGNADGSFGSAITMDSGGMQHGSDFAVDSVMFQLPVLGVPAGAADLAA